MVCVILDVKNTTDKLCLLFMVATEIELQLREKLDLMGEWLEEALPATSFSEIFTANPILLSPPADAIDS